MGENCSYNGAYNVGYPPNIVTFITGRAFKYIALQSTCESKLINKANKFYFTICQNLTKDSFLIFWEFNLPAIQPRSHFVILNIWFSSS